MSLRVYVKAYSCKGCDEHKQVTTDMEVAKLGALLKACCLNYFLPLATWKKTTFLSLLTRGQQ